MNGLVRKMRKGRIPSALQEWISIAAMVILTVAFVVLVFALALDFYRTAVSRLRQHENHHYQLSICICRKLLPFVTDLLLRAKEKGEIHLNDPKQRRPSVFTDSWDPSSDRSPGRRTDKPHKGFPSGISAA